MATYAPQSVGVQPPAGGFQQGGWYGGRQYWGGTLSEPGVIHPSSPQAGAGQPVSAEVNRQSAQAQNVSPQQFESYLQQQRNQQVKTQPTPALAPASVAPTAPVAPTTTAAPGGTGAPVTGFNQPTIDLPSLYNKFYESSGITGKMSEVQKLEADLAEKERQFMEAKAGVNDNPFLSEATRVGRIAKLEKLYQERTANTRTDIARKQNEVAMAKADIETQLNLQTKQFDINSQQAQLALSQFNTLLSAGAFNNATGEDIANVTRATGLSSAMIQSAVEANKKKGVETQVITSTADDGTVTATVMDKNTGTIISQKSLGQIGNKQTGATATQIKAQEEAANRENLIMSIKNYNNLADIVAAFGAVIDIATIYQLYNQYSPFGRAKESIEDVKEGKFKTATR